MTPCIELFAEDRSQLAALFALADDSQQVIEGYSKLGEVFVARCALNIVGQVQLITYGGEWEIKSLAVIEEHRGRGIGALLVRTALDRAFSSGAARVFVATATCDLDNLRFYQRLGFRMERIERDVFTAANGYPPVVVDGIPMRDQAWLSISNGS